MKIKDIEIAKKVKIPQIGLGLWQVKNKRNFSELIGRAYEVGYRHFDTAQIYGNEAYLGRALQEAGINRGSVFITSKLWNENQFYDDVIPAFRQTLKNLQTDYVDLFLIHFPVTELRGPAWRKMEEILASGRARAIGVSNYTVRHLEELMGQSSIKPAVNQVELHVYLQQPELIEYCKLHGIAVEAYSPLAHGRGMNNKVLRQIAKKHNATTAQVMIAWAVQRGFITIPKTTHLDRLAENLSATEITLDQKDLKLITSLDENYRTCWDPTNVP